MDGDALGLERLHELIRIINLLSRSFVGFSEAEIMDRRIFVNYLGSGLLIYPYEKLEFANNQLLIF